jgi:LysM repeat protein
MKKLIFIIIIFLFAGSYYLGTKTAKYQDIKSALFKATSSQAAITTADKNTITTESAISTTTTIAATTPIADNTKASSTRKEIIKHTIKEGDTLGAIAVQYGISVNTILSANNTSETSLLKIGQQLIILPFDGILYVAKNGDTISKIALLYKIDAGKIASANNIGENTDLKVGQMLIIPGATKTILALTTPAKTISARTTTQKTTTKKTTSKKATTANKKISTTGGVTWTSAALRELRKIPSSRIRATVKTKINNYAKSHGIKVITPAVYNSIHI